MGIERGSGDGFGNWLLRREDRRQSKSGEKKRGNALGGFHLVIINFLHLDAFDSWVLCGVALRPAVRPEPCGVYLLYSLLMGLGAILLTPYWLIQGIRHGKYLANLSERLGLSF